MRLSRKAINFDLSTNELNKHFKDTREPYNLIKDFMLENGFEHRQYSGYVSKEPMNDDDVSSLIRRISRQYSWLGACIQEFDITDIGERYSLKKAIQNLCSKNKKQEIYSTRILEQDSTKHYTPKEPEILEKSKQAIKKMKLDTPKSKNKDIEK